MKIFNSLSLTPKKSRNQEVQENLKNIELNFSVKNRSEISAKALIKKTLVILGSKLLLTTSDKKTKVIKC